MFSPSFIIVEVDSSHYVLRCEHDNACFLLHCVRYLLLLVCWAWALEGIL
jgi:hypothetical protein